MSACWGQEGGSQQAHEAEEAGSTLLQLMPYQIRSFEARSAEGLLYFLLACHVPHAKTLAAYTGHDVLQLPRSQQDDSF